MAWGPNRHPPHRNLQPLRLTNQKVQSSGRQPHHKLSFDGMASEAVLQHLSAMRGTTKGHT